MKGQKAENGRMKVFVRIKPHENDGKESLCVEAQKDQLQIMLNGHKDPKWYKFDGVFPHSSKNHEVYEHVGKPVVLGALNGFNGTVFAYGQTGSGKTHSLMSNDGITANMINKLFSKITRDRDHTCKIKFGYLQIYQEKMFDLLNEDSNLRLNVREDPSTGIYIENLAEYACHSPLDVLELLRMGQKKLIFAETKMNRRSSRSHAVCQISVIRSKRKAGDSEENTRRGQSVLSPIKKSAKGTKRTQSSSSRRRNSQNINRSVKFRTRSEGHLKTADSGEICVPQVDIAVDRPVSAVEPLDILDQNDQSFNSSLSIFDDSFTSSPDYNDEDDSITSLDKDVLLKGKINICDLAGSERIKLTGVEGERLNEAQHINLSLLELGNVIAALAEGNRTYVPYRNSLLTRLLQDSLGGNCKTTFLLCVSQGLHYFNETKSTLDFGQRALKVKTMPRVNVEVDYKMLADDLKVKLHEQEKSYSLLKAEYERLASKENCNMKTDAGDLVEVPSSLDENDGTSFHCQSMENCKEKAKSILMAQLMSLQLVYSIKDIADMDPATFPVEPDPDHNRNTTGLGRLKSSEQSLLSETERSGGLTSTFARTSSSSPSGYETASPRSSQDDVRGNQDDDTATSAKENWPQSSKEPCSLSNTCSPLLNKLRAPYSPRRSCILENLFETQLFGVNLESVLQLSAFTKTVNELKKEFKQLKSSIDKDLGQFCTDVFHISEPLNTSGHEVDCRNICAVLMQKLNDPTTADAVSPDVLDQLSNLIMVEQTLTGCLFALKGRSDTTRHSMLRQSQNLHESSVAKCSASDIAVSQENSSVTSPPEQPIEIAKKSKKKSRLQRFMCLPLRKSPHVK
ncbi:kinesin-related protein 5-like [Rhopilema esculentum]|uniref:kinesin-related protein 5-like n=1 Tax=Rhopilema esculentum TaxID=499914 RepID=UPI0031E3F717